MANRSKQKGTAAETDVVKYLHSLGHTNVERRALHGSNDRGDLSGLENCVCEVKNVARIDLAGWVDEAERERENDGSKYGFVWHKRKGTTDPGKWYVTMTGAQLVALLEAAAVIGK